MRARGGRAGGIPNTSALWRTPPEPFATGAGLHRVVWTPVSIPPRPAGAPGGGFFRGQGTPLYGEFTARLTVDGKTLSQQFTVLPDPRGTVGG